MYPNNSMKLVHVKLNESFLLTTRMIEQLTDSQLLMFLRKIIKS